MKAVAAVLAGILGFGLFSAGHAEQLTLERIHSDPNLNGPSLRQVKISPDCSRVTFLKSRSEDFERFDLWEYNLEDGEIRMLVDSRSLVPEEVELSEEEKARRERKRLFATGIVEYFWSDDGRALLFPLGGDLCYFDLTKPSAQATRRLTRTPEFETDARFSPEGRYVSFVRGQDLFIIDLVEGVERQLTLDGEDLIKNGTAEFIAQEEMDRYTGYWWSDDEAYIAFTQTDESPVRVSQRFEIYADTFKVIDQRYPRTGTANVIVKLGVLELATGETQWIDLGQETDIYLARVDWLPDSRHLSFQLQSRDQKSLELLFADAVTGETHVVLNESSRTWINLNEDLTFLEKAPQFVWASERDGYKHLYLYDLDGRLLRPLTAGDWAVERLLCVDEGNGTVYFSANAGSPLERHLYSASLAGETVPRIVQITTAEGWHSVEVAEDGRFYVDQFSSPETPPRVSLNGMDGTLIAHLEANTLDEGHPYYPYLSHHSPVQYGSIEAADGSPLYYRLTKPVPFEPEREYPAIVYVYGGPGGQTVTKSWRGQGGMWNQYMAQRGYVMFAIDNRGSGNRGKAFEDVLYRSLGVVEVEDQVRGVEFLRTLPFVDSENIGIVGHSYGGYMVLMAMMKAPDVFRVGVSLSPVTDWRLYDTHYTERYLGHPENNTEGYESSSVFPHVDGLRGDLLIIHGMADDNVLFSNSCKLFKVLQDKGVVFDIMTYPGSKHGLRGKKVGLHVDRTITRFFDERLKPGD